MYYGNSNLFSESFRDKKRTWLHTMIHPSLTQRSQQKRSKVVIILASDELQLLKKSTFFATFFGGGLLNKDLPWNDPVLVMASACFALQAGSPCVSSAEFFARNSWNYDESCATPRKATFEPLRSLFYETPWKGPKSPLNQTCTYYFFKVYIISGECCNPK